MRISEFEVLNHGIEHEQYFQGAGVSFTKWDDIVTGYGMTPYDALIDTLEIMAQKDLDLDESEEKKLKAKIMADKTEAVHEDTHCYLSIRYMLPKEVANDVG